MRWGSAGVRWGEWWREVGDGGVRWGSGGMIGGGGDGMGVEFA